MKKLLIGLFTLGFAVVARASFAATLSPNTLPTATINTPYAVNLQLSESTTTLIGWQVTNGTLPADLTLAPTSNNQGALLSGQPRTAGTFAFHIQAVNGTQVVADMPYVLTVYSMNGTGQFVIPHAQIGIPFSYTLPTTSGTAPFVWTVNAGNLPSGLSINSSGMIVGTPTASSTANVTLMVTDALGRTNSYPVTFSVDPATLAITTDVLPAGTMGTFYDTQALNSGGVAPYGWSVISGSLPPGLTIGSNGHIQGNPSVAGKYTLSLRTTDANGLMVDKPFTLVIN